MKKAFLRAAVVKVLLCLGFFNWLFCLDNKLHYHPKVIDAVRKCSNALIGDAFVTVALWITCSNISNIFYFIHSFYYNQYYFKGLYRNWPLNKRVKEIWWPMRDRQGIKLKTSTYFRLKAKCNIIVQIWA